MSENTMFENRIKELSENLMALNVQLRNTVECISKVVAEAQKLIKEKDELIKTLQVPDKRNMKKEKQ